MRRSSVVLLLPIQRLPIASPRQIRICLTEGGPYAEIKIEIL